MTANDDRPTYRERQARAERLRGWAEKNAARAETTHDTARQLADMIPFGQPILVGHHSERRHRRDLDRIHNGMGRAFELDDKAREQARRADSIEAAAARAIYDDDPDALDRLAEKLAELEAERAAIVAYNKTARKGAPDPSGLSPKWAGRAEGKPLPSYATSNLSGTIKTTRDRIARLESRRARTGTTAKPARLLTLRYAGTCEGCAAELAAGTVAYYDRAARAVTCQPCHEQGDRQ